MFEGVRNNLDELERVYTKARRGENLTREENEFWIILRWTLLSL